MKNNNRRKFIKSSGLLLGGLLMATNKSICKTLSAQYHGFYMDIDESNILFLHTGNQCGDTTFFKTYHDFFSSDTPIWLHTGDFLPSGKPDQSVIDSMNMLGVKAAALGANELQLGDKALLALAKACPFTLLHSHASWAGSELQRWVKPFEILQTHNRRIGIVAAGGGGAVHDPRARIEIESRARYLKEQQGVDLVISLIPTGANKAALLRWIHESKHIDTFLCSALEMDKSSNQVLKNADGKDSLLSYGDIGGQGVGRFRCNMTVKGLVLPMQLAYTHIPKEKHGLHA